MRPVKLTMTAFGPYKETEIIDFTELQDHRLFVVSGNTGAGKTSIFDAICFALYGEASGEDRHDSWMLRSHFAEDQVYTAVEFEFELKGERYRVLRQLPHIKEGNKSATGERYELYKLPLAGEPVPLTDRFIVSQIDQKLQELLGLTKDQFSQIVMLPQGEFRKLLTSETENKEEILRRIFKTGLYKVVAEQLNEKRKELQRSCESMEERMKLHLNQVRTALAHREGSELLLVFAQQHYNPYQVLEALELELQHLEANSAQLRGQLQDQNRLLQQQTAVYHQAEALNEQFQQLERKRGQQQELAAQEPLYQQKRQQLVLAEQAVQLLVYEKHAAEQEEELKRKTLQLEQAAQELARAEAHLHQAQQRHKLEEAREEERQTAARELDRLQSMQPAVQELERKRLAVAGLEQESTALARKLQQLEQELTAKQQERSQTAAELKKLEAGLEQLPTLTEKLLLLRQQALIMKEVLELQNKFASEATAEQEKKAAYEEENRLYLDMETRWVEGQAAVLASHLHDGAPCPVCGGLEHPHKATYSGQLPTKEELEQQRNIKAAQERLYLEIQASRSATTAQLTTKLAQLQEQGVHTDSLQQDYNELVRTGKALSEEVKQLKEQQERLQQLKPQHEALEQREEQLRKDRELHSLQYNERNTLYQTEKALYEQALTGIPEELRTPQQLNSRIANAEEHRNRMELAWKEVQQQLQAATEHFIQAKATANGLQTQQQEAAANKEKALTAFHSALQAAGFTTEEAYLQAKLPESRREALKQELEDYQTAVNTLQQQLTELTASLQGKEPQNLLLLKEQLQERELKLEALRTELLRNDQDHQKGLDSQASIKEVEQQRKLAEQQFQLVKDLFDVVRGDNSKKISFERYLQIEFLEQIIMAANQRLQRISGGQFVLVRSDRLEKRGKQSGLGLDVYDNYTGQLRDVKSMSGGEKFNASLCLALGMADVIQAFEGGISLETMFIDEGFGSLDEEALNKAIDTLVDLQQTGRMIGIISHVQELKAAIPAVLEVKKTKEGYSYTEFSIS